MRPVRLQIEGFSGFADRVEVDLGDDDLFALVGPTGAGKSSVIDAMIFALYGAVPRYGDERLVAPIIHQLKAEAAVRLDFEVAGTAYVAVRVVRRTRTGATTKEARLERDGVALAGDARAVSAAVRELVGLDFAQFCKTVVLPQGAFAQFLHDLPARRQELLQQLLDLGLYDRIRKAAQLRADGAQAALDALAARLAELAVPTAEERAAADEDAGRLAALLARVREAAADHARRAGRLEALATRRAAVQAERERLGRVRVPEGLAEVDAAGRAAAERGARAAAAATAAEQALAAATSARAAGPDPASLARWSEARAARGRLDAELAALAAASAETELVLSRLEAVAARLVRGDEERAVLAARVERLGAVGAAAPPDADEVVAEAARTDDAARGAATQAAVAVQRHGLAVDALAAAGERRALAAALDQARRRDAARAEAAELVARVEAAQRAATQAAEVHARARQAQETAEARLDQARREQAAAALAQHLHVGDACPVCGRVVDGLPLVEGGGDLDAARAATEGAAQAERRAVRAEAEAESRHAGLVERLTAAQAEAAAHDEARPVAQLEAALDRLDALERARDEAADARAAAEGLAATADAARTTADARASAVRTTLEVARARVADDGPPAPSAAVDRGWAELARWAAAGAEAAGTALDALRATHAELAAERDGLAGRVVATCGPAGIVLDPATVAAGAVRAVLRDRAERAAQRRAEHDRALADAPDEAELARLQAQLQGLEAAVVDAQTALERAVGERGRAGAALAEARLAEDDLRADLAATRDRVADLGPPALAGPGAGLLDDGRALTAWATSAAAERDAELAGLADESGQLATDQARAEADLVDDCRTHGVATTAAEAVVAVAEARATAAGRLEDITARLARAAQLRADETALVERRAVADDLATHLRANRFERWLVEEALRELVAAATRRLLGLSSGAYSLRLAAAGHDFEVVDHRNADERRPVRTLSGGETFLTALALALALGELIAEGEARPVHLDALFLDEGFGSLDAETLDTAASAIEELGATGRMVGVVTHVRELAERMPVRFEVRRSGAGAVVERVVA